MEFDLRMDSPIFGSIHKILTRLFILTYPFVPRVLITERITHNISHNTNNTLSMTPYCMQPKLSLHSNNISYVNILVCSIRKDRSCISAYRCRGCSRPRFGSYIGSESSFTSISTRKSLSLVKDKTRFSRSTSRFSVALVTKKHKYFPGICDAAGGKAATPHIPGLCFQRSSMFLYSLLKSAANAVQKLMFAVIAIAHVLFVSVKSLSVNIMLHGYSFGKLNYDSTTLPMSRFLRSSSDSASRSPVSHTILNFFMINFLLRVSPTPTLRAKISIDVPVDRKPDIKSRLDAGMNNCSFGAAQEGSSLSVFMYFMLSRSIS